MESSAGTMSPDATPTSALPDAAAAPTDSARSGPGALPNLIVIGAQKCGTSGLHYYLSLHPEISVSRPKELNFFIAERNWPRGVDWYRSHFDPNAKVRSEASPNYTAYPQHLEVPERMHSVLPDAKLLYMVRDPLDRIAAHWVHNKGVSHEINWAWDELKTVERLVPDLIEVKQYDLALRDLTARSNEDLFTMIEESSRAYEEGDTRGPDPEKARRITSAIREELLDLRNGWVRRNADTLLEAITVDEVRGPVTAPQVH